MALLVGGHFLSSFSPPLCMGPALDQHSEQDCHLHMDKSAVALTSPCLKAKDKDFMSQAHSLIALKIL